MMFLSSILVVMVLAPGADGWLWNDLKDFLKDDVRTDLNNWLKNKVYFPVKSLVLNVKGDVENWIKEPVKLAGNSLTTMGYSIAALGNSQKPSADHTLPSPHSGDVYKLRVVIAGDNAGGANSDDDEMLILKFRTTDNTCVTNAINDGWSGNLLKSKTYEFALPDDFSPSKPWSLSVGHRGSGVVHDYHLAFDGLHIGMLVLLRDGVVHHVVDFRGFGWWLNRLNLGSGQPYSNRLRPVGAFSTRGGDDNTLGGIQISDNGKDVRVVYGKRYGCSTDESTFKLRYDAREARSFLAHFDSFYRGMISWFESSLQTLDTLFSNFLAEFQSQQPSNADRTCEMGGGNDVSLFITVPEGGGTYEGYWKIWHDGRCYDDAGCVRLQPTLNRYKFGSRIGDIHLYWTGNNAAVFSKIEVFYDNVLYSTVDFTGSRWEKQNAPGRVATGQRFAISGSALRYFKISSSGKVSWSDTTEADPKVPICSNMRKRKLGDDVFRLKAKTLNTYSKISQQVQNGKKILGSFGILKLIDTMEDIAKTFADLLKLVPDFLEGTVSYFESLPFTNTYGAKCLSEMLRNILGATNIPQDVVDFIANDVVENVFGAIVLALDQFLGYFENWSWDASSFGAGTITGDVLFQAKGHLASAFGSLSGDLCPLAYDCYSGYRSVLVPNPAPVCQEYPSDPDSMRRKRGNSTARRVARGVNSQGVSEDMRNAIGAIRARNRVTFADTTLDIITPAHFDNDPASWPVIPASYFGNLQQAQTSVKIVFNLLGTTLWKVVHAISAIDGLPPQKKAATITIRHICASFELIGNLFTNSFDDVIANAGHVNNFIKEYKSMQQTDWNVQRLSNAANSWAICATNPKVDFSFVSVDVKKFAGDGDLPAIGGYTWTLDQNAEYWPSESSWRGTCRLLTCDRAGPIPHDEGWIMFLGVDVFVKSTGYGKNGNLDVIKHRL